VSSVQTSHPDIQNTSFDPLFPGVNQHVTTRTSLHKKNMKSLILSTLVAATMAQLTGQHEFCPGFLSTRTSLDVTVGARRLLARVPNSTSPNDPVIEGKTLAWGGIGAKDADGTYVAAVFALTATDTDRRQFNMVKTTGTSFKIPRAWNVKLVNPANGESVLLETCPETPFKPVVINTQVKLRTDSQPITDVDATFLRIPTVVTPSCAMKGGKTVIALSWQAPTKCGYKRNHKCWGNTQSCFRVCVNGVKKGPPATVGGLTGWSYAGSANPRSSGLGLGSRPYVTSSLSSDSNCK